MLKARLCTNKKSHKGARVRFIFFSIFFVTACGAAATIDGASPFYPTSNFFSSTYPLKARGLKTSLMTFDGKNSKIFFPANDIPVILISPSKTLMIQNVTLVGFRPSHVQLQGSGSRLLLGSGVRWELESDLDFSKTMTVVGAVSVQGKGNVISFASKNPFLVTEKASLEINGCKIKGMGDFIDRNGQNATSIMCASSARLALCNTTCFLDSSWSFTAGSLDIAGKTAFKGMQKIFTYISGSNFTINSYASLAFTRGMTFLYASKAGRNKLKLTDPTAQLYFDGATFVCGANGLTLSSGMMFLKGDVPFGTQSHDISKGFILDDSLLTVIQSNSSLSVDGVVVHGQSS